jgi:hypothetical protein
MIKMDEILSEKGDADFGDVAFGDPWQDMGYPTFLKMQGKSAKDKEDNTKTEKRILDALADWVTGSANYISNELTRLLPALKKGKKRFPNIFVPDQSNGTVVYRGLDKMNKNLEKTLIDKTTKKDWRPMRGFMLCTKPVKYSPRRDWQSWSYSTKVAKNFGGDAVLLTKQDNNFYFSSKTMRIIYGNENEQEVLHNGKTFSAPVYIAINEYYFNKFMSNKIGSPDKGKKQGLKTVSKQLFKKSR